MLDNTLFSTSRLMPVTNGLLNTITEINLNRHHARYARVRQLLGADGAALTTPGVVVLEIDESIVIDGMTMAGLVYWVVDNDQVVELDETAAAELRLGDVVGWLDLGPLADVLAVKGRPGEVRFNATTEPLAKLVSFGALNEGPRVLEELEMRQLEIRLVAETFPEEV